MNPFMGYAPWATSITDESALDVSLAFVLLYWKDFEPQKGFYDFDAFEAAINLEYLRSKNIKIIIRVVCDYPTTDKHIDIPGWLYDKMDGAGTFYDDGNGLSGFVPDYSHPDFIEQHAQLIEALAARYENSPDLAFVQLGSLGHWGEWHNVAAPASPFPDTEITDIYVNQYAAAFTHTKLQMRRPHTITRNNAIGLYNDMTGHEESTALWLGWINDFGMEDFYNSSPSGGEFASTYPFESYFGERYKSVRQQVADSHMSYIANLPPENEELQENVADLLKTMGYRLTVRYAYYTPELLHGDDVLIQLSIENIGIAPFYYPWSFCYFFYDQNGNLIETYETQWDVRKILPQTSDTYTDKIPISLPTGDYTVCLGLVNPDTKTPAVRFANAEMDSDCLLTIGNIHILN